MLTSRRKRVEKWVTRLLLQLCSEPIQRRSLDAQLSALMHPPVIIEFEDGLDADPF